LPLANIYASTGQLNEAQHTADDLIKKYPGSEIEKQALILEASLSGYDQKLSDISLQALGTLETEFSSSIDSGLVVALGGFNISPGLLNKSAKHDSSATEKNNLSFQLENYPNPFSAKG